MKKSKALLFSCPQCEKQQWFFVAEKKAQVACVQCSYKKEIVCDERLFDSCPFCECRAFFLQKNVHPRVMFLGLFVAIVFLRKSYGLSFVFLWIVDRFLSRVISDLLVCYRCRSSFKDFEGTERFKEFQHHIGEKYDRLK